MLTETTKPLKIVATISLLLLCTLNHIGFGQDKIEDLEKKLNDAYEDFNKKDVELKKEKKISEKLNEDLMEAKKDLTDKQKKITSLTDKEAENIKQITILQNQIKTLKTDNAALSNENQKNKSLEIENTKLTGKIESAAKANLKNSSELAEIKKTKVALEKELTLIKSQPKESTPSPLLIILAIACAFVSCALAIFSFGLLNLKLKSKNGEVVTLQGSLEEFQSRVHQLTEDLNDLYRKNLQMGEKIAQPIDDIKIKYDHHDESLSKQTLHLNQIQEMMSSIKAIAEEKKNELDDYKEGYVISKHKKIINALCEARDKIEMIRAEAEKYNSPEALIKYISAVDIEIKDTLEMDWDLLEIDISVGDQYNREASEIDLLPVIDTDKIEKDNTIAAIPTKGYRLLVHNNSSEPETKPFRTAKVKIYKHKS